MKAIIEKYVWDHDTDAWRIVIDLKWTDEDTADEIRRGVQSYLDLIQDIEEHQ